MDRRQNRPNHIEVPPYQHNSSQRAPSNTRHADPSPRPGHHSPRAGDVAPALSPLDAFAFHSSLLARQFEGEEGRRISRLPHLTVANELGKTRHHNYYNSSPRTHGSEHTAPATLDQSGVSPELSRPDFRPQSFYPTLSNVDDLRSSTISSANPLDSTSKYPERPVQMHSGARSCSPDPIQELPEPQEPRQPPSFTAPASLSTEPATRRPAPPKKSPTNDSGNSTISLSTSGLAPPNSSSPGLSTRSPRLQPSVRSVRTDSGDDTDTLSVNGHLDHARDRVPSVSSGQGRPRSPFSPVFAPRRSPSMSSEHSTAQGLLPRRSQNFSRPMSPHPRAAERDGRPSVDAYSHAADSPFLRPSFDATSIQDSLHSPAFPSAPYADATVPDSTDDERNALVLDPRSDANDTSSSYTYAKYTLPRGRVVSRTSISATDFFNGKFYWDNEFRQSAEVQESAVPPSEVVASASKDDPQAAPRRATDQALEEVREAVVQPLLRSSSTQHDRSTPPQEAQPLDVPIAETPKKQARKSRFVEANIDDDLPTPQMPLMRPSSSQGLSSRVITDSALTDRPRTSSGEPKKLVRGHKSNPSFPPPVLPTNESQRVHQSNQSRDDLSVLPSLSAAQLRTELEQATPRARDQLPPETHLAKGIASHETGQLQKSTYHLRIAARAGLPTAMLLYGLAARHGWGMRANQTEAVTWLRKAVDSAGLSVSQDERGFGDAADEAGGVAGPEQVSKRRAHKAQLALAIYELGVSYMNGWGTPQDRALALKCFDIAGAWGDADALTEAGFCYTKGLGCKKDLKKAAALYREAEKRGISMAGNSWIYKEKYMPREEAERKGRGEDKDKNDKEKKPRDKSRTRSIFSRRKTLGATDRPEVPLPT